MADGTNVNDVLISAMDLAQKWVDDVLENETGSPESRVDHRGKLYQKALDNITAETHAGFGKLTARD